MANSLLETTDKTIKTVRKRVKKAGVTKAVKKSPVTKTVSKAVEKTSARTKAAAFFAIGATSAAGAYLLRRRGAGDAEAGQAA
jgi:hypothetical protein